MKYNKTRQHNVNRIIPIKNIKERRIKNRFLQINRILWYLQSPPQVYQTSICFTFDCYLCQLSIFIVGDKPHECLVCGKKFALQCNLRTHMKTHESKYNIDKDNTF